MSKKIASAIIVFLSIILAAFSLASCTTLGISLQTDYGRLTYELPEPKGTKK
jgi:hypothetical protein